MSEQTTAAGAAAPATRAPKPKPPKSIPATDLGKGRMAIVPRDFDEAWRIAEAFAAAGDMVPKCYRNNPNAAFMAVMWSMELGITPIQGIQGIAVIGGRASVWGDLMLSLVMIHPDLESFEERPMLDGGEVVGFVATCKRKGRDPVARQFTLADANSAGLLIKEGPWQTYRQRMLQMRARSWSIRDCMPDALRGLSSADEMIDVTPVSDTAPTREPIRQPQARAAEAERVPLTIEHQENPLDQLNAGGFADGFAGWDPVAVERAGDAGNAMADDHSALDEGGAFGGLFGSGEAAPAIDRTPISPAMADKLSVWQNRAEAFGVSEQDLVDELGDTVNVSNVARAIDWLKGKCGQ